MDIYDPIAEALDLTPIQFTFFTPPPVKVYGIPPTNKGIPKTEEQRRRQSLGQLGHTVSAETRVKIGSKARGRKNPHDGRSGRNRIVSDETRAKYAVCGHLSQLSRWRDRAIFLL